MEESDYESEDDFLVIKPTKPAEAPVDTEPSAPDFPDVPSVSSFQPTTVSLPGAAAITSMRPGPSAAAIQMATRKAQASMAPFSDAAVAVPTEGAYDPSRIALMLYGQDKPWTKPGADISNWFNYGFNEWSYARYVGVQRKLRDDKFVFRYFSHSLTRF